MSIHSELIARLVAERGYFAKHQKRRILDAVYGKCACVDGNQCWRCTMSREMDEMGRLVPDAVHIDAAAEVVTICEVEVTSRLDERKIAGYENWAWILDEEYWRLRLLVVSRLGAETEMELIPYHLEHDPMAIRRVSEILCSA
jgi:hypothetical protein